MRAVLDPNILISALLSPRGAPARCLRAFLAGAFELVVSPLLLAELERALGYPKLRGRVLPEEAERFIAGLREQAVPIADTGPPFPRTARDPGDDYLIALAAGARAVLVTGDRHLLELSAANSAILAPATFLTLLEEQE